MQKQTSSLPPTAEQSLPKYNSTHACVVEATSCITRGDEGLILQEDEASIPLSRFPFKRADVWCSGPFLGHFVI